MSFPLPEFQYSMPVVARPRYNELSMHFPCFSFDQIFELAMCMPNMPLHSLCHFRCQNFNILCPWSLDPDIMNYLCMFRVLALPNSLSLPCVCPISLDTAYVISVARISIFYARGS